MGFLGDYEGEILDFSDFDVHNVSHYVPNEFSTCFPRGNSQQHMVFILYCGRLGVLGFYLFIVIHNMFPKLPICSQ
jgi:hypothetical protein